MQTTVTVHIEKKTPVEGYILDVLGLGRTMYLSVGSIGGDRTTFILSDPAFLDRLANEAERLCREFVGDAAPLEPLHMTGQYCQCVDCAGVRMSAGPV